jgi:pyruvate kinase
LGPACWSVSGLTALIDAGMNVARFNFSHGDHEVHGECLDRLREAIASRPGCNVAALLDTKGPEIRTGVIDPSLNGKLKLIKNSIIEVGTDYSKLCTPEYLACSYDSLPKSVKVGSPILAADGSVSLRVTEVREKSVMAEVLNNAIIGDKKNMNLPGAVVDLPTLTEKDIHDLKSFGVAKGFDFIAASFVRKASDIDYIREVLGEEGKGIKIIAKIENQEGLDNYDEILETTDGIMVARGDLGMEIPIQKVFLAQKMMINKANNAGIPIVTATQMLESMINAPRPTRAECADVANAVLDGTCVVMLSGETANGEYGVEAVQMMSQTCMEAESLLNNDEAAFEIRKNTIRTKKLTAGESLAYSACSTAIDVRATCIIVISVTGKTAARVAKYKPSVPVIVLTASQQVANQVNGYMKNTRCTVLPTLEDANLMISSALENAVNAGFIKKGDSVVTIYGNSDRSYGNTNTLQVHTA